MSWKPDYGYPEQYHKDVVEACVELMGEENRDFFDHQCSYESHYEEGQTPQECAEAQYEALT